jgi:hypothetical protein
MSLDSLAAAVLGKTGAIEIGLMASHESDHGDYPAQPQPDAIPYGGGGEFFTPDIAMRISLAKQVDVQARVQCPLYAAGAFIVRPGADITLRWKPNSHMHPFLTVFAEGLVARPASARDGYLV